MRVHREHLCALCVRAPAACVHVMASFCGVAAPARYDINITPSRDVRTACMHVHVHINTYIVSNLCATVNCRACLELLMHSSINSIRTCAWQSVECCCSCLCARCCTSCFIHICK